MICSCSSQRDTATSRALQNLTARYNYLYNAKATLSAHQQELTETYVDNYDQILPVYLGPENDSSFPGASLNLKPMDDIIKKAQNIILEKNYSNYLDDAYLLLGKANFYNGSYFNAAEYFDYTIKTYKNNTGSYLEALNWKARSLMQLKRIAEANQVLDTMEAIMPIVKAKRNRSEPLATLAQMCIYLKNNEAAISYLKDAVKSNAENQNKIRWTYILGQLFESQKNYGEASKNYRKVERSNAPFEMYFNANLNQIKLRGLQGKTGKTNEDELLSLLKDDKNLDYNDQIYFQVAEAHASKEEYDEAKKFYQLSIQRSTANLYQKGLSYLRIADLNFKQFKNYPEAKSYYDSTIATLPKSYPGYDLIAKKTQNLAYLTNRLQIIATEDTLQYIARQPEASRAPLIEALANPPVQASQQPNENNTSANMPAAFGASQGNKNQSQNSFYFSNPTAVSIGFNDFKKKWGGRKLENNWRQSMRSSAQETTQDLANSIAADPAATGEALPLVKDKATLVKQYTDALPVTPDLLTQSNQKIIDAYYEIASFYLQELQDPEEAEETYTTLVKRFPSNNHLPAVYYSLFLINKEKNPAKSNEFKSKVLTEFPGSIYAKTIPDPNFSAKQSEFEAALNKKYNDIFDKYASKEFGNVIAEIKGRPETAQGLLSPQFAYLNAISIGRTADVNALIQSLDSIILRFPEDKLITPLVKAHLSYIMAHLDELKKRPIAITDFDPNEPPFLPATKATSTVVTQQQESVGSPVPVVSDIVKKTDPLAAPVLPNPPVAAPIVAPEKIKTEGPFSNAKSTVYYYVIDVADASLTLSSSRFGIGQFNRGNYSGSNLKHQIKEFDNDQLIYVGNFSNFEDAKSYASGIDAQLKQIMKVPVNVYSSFIVSKENFEKLTNKDLLNKYMEFYKNNY
ncbi:MAG: tetratricopeptide repeat protein [Bacteroidota bacterium]